MCNCIKDLQERLKNKLASDEDMEDMKPKNAESLRYLICENMALMISNWKNSLGIPFLATWKLKNGKSKDTKIRVTASHCPFCGEAFEKQEEEAIDS